QVLEITDKLTMFGHLLGLLFQITDDILDVTASTEQLGKPAGSDQRQSTPTYVSVYGLARAQELAQQTANAAFEVLDHIQFETGELRLLLNSVLERKN